MGRLKVRKILVAALACAAFAIAGDIAAAALIERLQSRQMHDHADAGLRRAEDAVAYAAATLDDIAARGVPSCEAAALQAVRLHVYQRGALKDVRVLDHDGAVRCSAYADTLEFDREWPTRAGMTPDRAGRLWLFPVEQFSGTALGVASDVDAHTTLAAIVGVSAAMFDVLPRDLREGGGVALELANGRIVAQNGAFAGGAKGRVAVATSTALPMRVAVRVAGDALAARDRELHVWLVLGAGGLGLAFGLLLTRVLGRPPDPAAEIDRGLSLREFTPWLQPLFDLRTGEIVGCEALARWVREDGIVSPARFIPLAETTGRIEAITWQILERGLIDLRALMETRPSFKASFNIAPAHLASDGFVEDLLKVVAATGAPIRQIVLEITEREPFHDLARAAAVIERLRRLGVRIALDDVGIGHSGLSSIQALGADILKIDKFFVDSVGRDAAAAAIIEMLVRLARELRLTVVAEGVESEAQRRALADCGVGQGQGYLVSPPLPAADFLAFLEARCFETTARREAA